MEVDFPPVSVAGANVDVALCCSCDMRLSDHPALLQMSFLLSALALETHENLTKYIIFDHQNVK